MRQYPAKLISKGKEYPTYLDWEMNSDNEHFFQVNGVRIEFYVDDMELYIDAKEFNNYSEEQLRFLTYYVEPKTGCVTLTDYSFVCSYPIKVLDVQNGNVFETPLEIRINYVDTGNPFGKRDFKSYENISYIYSILDTKVEIKPTMYDGGFQLWKLQKEISEKYRICACAFCKYGQDCPYAPCSNPYYDYYCFSEYKEYWSKYDGYIGKGNWEEVDRENLVGTRAIYWCEKFEQRKSNNNA